ncbi:MAG: 50S ribosomal protein L10 [Candidatus ainarchaeum sp.]|nr:50S ribosomal protein L10 [Candidatus ainarchaeum sp.]
MTSHIRKWKEVKKDEIIKLVGEYPFVAVATLNELPASILSVLRKKLINDTKIIVAKTRVVKMAFSEAKINSSELNSVVKESIAIIFSKKNPFELFSFIKKNKGDTTAKEGDIAEKDIIIQAGDTGLAPGPALSLLKGVGLKVQVQGPTISITADKIVVKKGEEINAQIADVLSKLNMKPIKIGMKIIGVLDKSENQFYPADVLNVDEEELFDKFVLAYQQALNLSVNAGYFNNESTEIIIIKAEREAKAIKQIVDENKTEKENVDKSKVELSDNKNELNDEIVEQVKVVKEDDTSEKKVEVKEIAEQAIEETKIEEKTAKATEEIKESEEKGE